MLVAGAGTAGAATARACARRGLSVLCLERGPLDQAGARWVNGVPAWAFDAAGLPRPAAPEVRGAGDRFHMVAGWGPTRVTVDAAGLLDVDMRLLVARLQRDAVAAGATLRGGCAVTGFSPLRPGARVHTTDGDVRARVVVDATGLAGANLAGAPRPPRAELCAAAQEVRAISDPQAARDWCRAQDVAPGETLCFTGIAGGYSIVNVRVEVGGVDPHVSILTGSIPADGQPGGQALLDRFAAEHAWVGPTTFGGSRAIPLTPPAASLAEGPLVTLGDASSQVFAAHGSGIAAGMIAAGQLAELLEQGATPWDWNVRWQRTWGALVAPANHFARFSRSLDAGELRAVMASGLMPPGLARQTLLQHPARPRPADLARLLRGASRERAIARRFLPVVTTMLRLERMYRRYPRRAGAVSAWAARRDRLLGEIPG